MCFCKALGKYYRQIGKYLPDIYFFYYLFGSSISKGLALLHHTYHLLVKGSITCGCEPPLSMCRAVGINSELEGHLFEVVSLC